MKFRNLLGFALITSSFALTACIDGRREQMHVEALPDPVDMAPRMAPIAQRSATEADVTNIDAKGSGQRTAAHAESAPTTGTALAAGATASPVASPASPTTPAASPEAASAESGVTAAASDEARIPDPYRLPGSAAPQVGGAIQARGASTLIGQAKVEPGKLVLELTGGKAGRYAIYRGGADGCTPAPAPAEMVTGQVDVAQRTGGDITDPKRTARPAATKIGDISMGDDGVARFEATLSKTDLGDKSMTLMIEEEARTANPSLADASGLVACGRVDLSAASPRG